MASMENTPNTKDLIEALIGRWPSRKAFAEEIGAKLDAVHKWAQSGRIPSGWQYAVHVAASARGFDDVTPEWLLSVHAVQLEQRAG